jgi:hypothetical protein
VKLKKNNVLFSYKADLQVGLGPKNYTITLSQQAGPYDVLA